MLCGRRPQWAMTGMPARHEGGDRFGLLDAAFEFHGLAARFLQDAAGVFDRPVRAQVKAGERHVDDHQRVLDRAADHLGVVDHFVERDGQRAVVPLDDHRHAVADENALDAGRVHEPRERVVVRRDHRDLATGRFEAGELGDGDALGGHCERCKDVKSKRRKNRQQQSVFIVACT